MFGITTDSNTSDLCDIYTLFLKKKSYFYAVKWFQYVIVQFSDDYLDVVMNRDRHDMKFTHPPASLVLDVLKSFAEPTAINIFVWQNGCIKNNVVFLVIN